MIEEGQIVLFSFPATANTTGKVRPAAVLRRLPGQFDDWLLCMISTQIQQEISGLDEVIRETDADFSLTGLKKTSLVRITRLAVVASDLLHGTIGNLSPDRLASIRLRISDWIK